jgi:hypothetical protein
LADDDAMARVLRTIGLTPDRLSSTEREGLAAELAALAPPANNDDDPRALAQSVQRVGSVGQTGHNQRSTSRTPKPLSADEERRLDGLSPKQLADELLPTRGF